MPSSNDPPPPPAPVSGALERAYIAGALEAELSRHLQAHNAGAASEVARMLAASGEYRTVLGEGGRLEINAKSGLSLGEDVQQRVESGAFDGFGRRFRPVEQIAAEQAGRQAAERAANRFPPPIGWPGSKPLSPKGI